MNEPPERGAKGAIHAWGAIIVAVALSAIGWFDSKLEGHLKMTSDTQLAGFDNARKIVEGAEFAKVQTLWIQEVQKALEPIRAEQNRFNIEMNNLRNDLSNMKAPAARR